MRTRAFLQGMALWGVDFFTGVPDSLLKPLCDTLYAEHGCTGRHVVAANEGGAAALAAGHYIATGKPALCYLQNSGIGNMINPAASLLHGRVYGIPCVYVVGWRGEPGIKDEPQHAFQGLITRELLSLLDLTVLELSRETTQRDFSRMLVRGKALLEKGRSVAWLVHAGALTDGAQVQWKDSRTLSREDALYELLRGARHEDIFVSTTGKASREVFELRRRLGHEHAQDFLTVGSMGHANMIALGIARARPERRVWCLDGDGAALMHLGGLVVEAQEQAPNLIHILLNNGAHESVGGMPVAGGGLRFAPLAKAAGYKRCLSAENREEWLACLGEIRLAQPCPIFAEVLLKQGSRKDLGRPTQTPKENLQGLMNLLGKWRDTL